MYHLVTLSKAVHYWCAKWIRDEPWMPKPKCHRFVHAHSWGLNHHNRLIGPSTSQKYKYNWINYINTNSQHHPKQNQLSAIYRAWPIRIQLVTNIRFFLSFVLCFQTKQYSPFLPPIWIGLAKFCILTTLAQTIYKRQHYVHTNSRLATIIIVSQVQNSQKQAWP